VTRTFPIAFILFAAFAPSAVAGAHQPVVRSVKAAASAPAGLPLAVQVKVARPSRTTLRFYLSSDGRRDAQDPPLAPGVRVGRKAVVAGRPAIPAAQAPGSYFLIACIEQSCKARPLRVTEKPVGTRDLVAQAVAAGRLTPQQGLVYRVFAAFGDKRLPTAFQGDGAAPDDEVMAEVLAAWPQLSRAQRAQVQPFFTPPAARRSLSAKAAQITPGCVSDRLPDREWFSTAPQGGHVRVWWQRSDTSRIGRQAKAIAQEVEQTMWPKLRAVMGREPISDGRIPCFHGVDGKLDIYFMPLADVGVTGARGATIPYPPFCSKTPAFVVMRDSAPNRWEVAHEVMHAFQFAFRTAGSCSSYMPWWEASATWAGQHLYPQDDDEHGYPWFLRQPDSSLIGTSYDGWVFPFAMERLHGAATIGAIHAQGERLGVAQAIDAAVPGGLAKAWPEFARLGWNQDPVSPTFKDWDRFSELPRTPGLHGGPIPTETIDSGVIDVPLNLEPLTRTYRHFKLGDRIRQIKISAPAHPGLSVQALIKLGNETTRTEDWSGNESSLCLRSGDERPQEIVLVIANSSLAEAIPAGSALKLGLSNIGCQRYVGWVEGTLTARPTDPGTNVYDESWRADVVFDYVEWHNPPIREFELASGSVRWSMSGHNPYTGCTWTAETSGAPVTHGHLSIGVDVKPPWDHTYDVHVEGASQIPGTTTCPSSHGPVTTAGRFATTALLVPQMPPDGLMRRIPADGVLEGTNTHTVFSPDVTATYTWHLEPDG
jgi:hypothetical protein